MHMERRRPLGDSGIHQKPPISYPHFRDNSFDHGSRNPSPTPPEPPKFMVRPSPSFTPVPSSALNDYQIPLKKAESHGIDHSQVLNDLVQRVRNLESKADQGRKVQFHIEMLEGKTGKIVQRLETLENSKRQAKQDKQNIKVGVNGREKQLSMTANLITRQELERQMKNLEGSFKSLIQGLKNSLTTEVKDMHGKEKKRMIEIVAAQLNSKMQEFKDQTSKDIQQKLSSHTSLTNMGLKNFLGVGKDSISTAVILREHLIVEQTGKEIAAGETKYFVDTFGWLMDSNKSYIVDGKGLKIMLSDRHFQMLKKEGVINGGGWGRQDLPLTNHLSN